ncbi:MAG: DUF3363 domain-containing protein [Pseudomonadota bacterium]
MSGEGDDFRPRLGRIGNRGKRSAGSVLSHVRAARRSGGGRSAFVRPARYAGGGRRVMVKARIVRIAGKGLGLQRAHLSYLQRDGAGKDQERGEFYDRETEGVEGREFLQRGREDRHHFRFIVSPEDGEQLGDLKPFVRELMGQMEADQGTRLDWIAMDHHDTDHPHAHVIVRGVCDDGRDLVMDRDYISRGIRQRAGAILTRQLGLETTDELGAKLDRLTEAPRVTRMDRLLAQRARETGAVDLGDLKRLQKHYRARLRYLARQGLAKEVGGGRWAINPNLTRVLERIEHQDLAMGRIRLALRDAGIERPFARDNWDRSSRETLGRVVATGMADEHTGRSYIILDGMDGRAHHVELKEPVSRTDLSDLVRVGEKQIERLDRRSLEEQVRAPGLTWLDRHLAGQDRAAVLQAGFGAEVAEAAQQRLDALERRGLIRGMDPSNTPDAATLEKLRWAGIHHEGRKLAKQTGLDYRPAAPGKSLGGTLEKSIDTPSGRLAVIKSGSGLELALVPWNRDMKRYLNRGISMDISQTMGLSRLRERSLGLSR